MANCPDCGKKFKKRKNVTRCKKCEDKRSVEAPSEPSAISGTLLPASATQLGGTLVTPEPERLQDNIEATESDGTLLSTRDPKGTLVPSQSGLPDDSNEPPLGTLLSSPEPTDISEKVSHAEKDSPSSNDRRTVALPPDAIAKPKSGNQDDLLSTSDFIRSLPSDFASPSATIRVDALRQTVMDCTPAMRSLIEKKDGSKSKDVDYEVLGKIGEGGMGVIYRALQKSVNREVAIKKIKVDVADKTDIKSKFITEAAFTGELAHPNIVPIHDLGLDSDGSLFYSMKVVDGEPWETVLPNNSRAENLDILLRISDAIAFAHSKSIIHRDLKPENIMIGEFGEVVVMDWGLAAKFDDGKQPAPGGSPAYMAPEMANAFLATMKRAIPGETTEVGDYSDVYLLGAMLFELATGKPPHNGGEDVVDRRYEVFNCLSNAAQNNFVSVADPTDPLVEIALKAMATNPNDRYRNVEAFQGAIREYEAHAQSIGLAERAENDLQKAEETRDYDVFARSLFGFQDALELWPENSRAVSGEQNAKLSYAQAALAKNDFDLGLSLLDPSAPTEADLHKKLQRAAAGRDRREGALRLFKLAVVGLGAALLLGGAFFVKRERDANLDKIQQANEIARKNKELESTVKERDTSIHQLEQTKTKLTTTVGKLDERNKELTETQIGLQKKTEEAVRSSKLAQDRLFQAEFGDFASSVALARSNIDDGAFESAIDSLDRIRAGDTTRSAGMKSDWEWGRLRYLSHPEIKYHQTGGRDPHVAISSDNKIAVSAAQSDEGGVVRAWDVESQKLVHEWIVDTAARLNDVAITPDGKLAYIACTTVGPNQPSIIGWSTESGKRVAELQTHFSKKDLGDARQIEISGTPPYKLLSSGSAREANDESVLSQWQVASTGQLRNEQNLKGYFAQATNISVSSNGTLLLSVHKRKSKSASFLRSRNLSQSGQKPRQIDSRKLDAGTIIQFHPTKPNVFAAAEGDTLYRYDLAGASSVKPTVIHRFASTVESFTYSPDGSEIVCGTNEGTLVRFDLKSRTETSTLGGHESSIVDCKYRGEILASVDQFGGLRFWNLSNYRDEFVQKSARLVSASIRDDGLQVASLSSSGIVSRGSTESGAKKIKSTSCGYRIGMFGTSETIWRHYDVASKRLFTMTTKAGDTRGSIRIWNADGRPSSYKLSVASTTLLEVAPGGKQVILAIPKATSATSGNSATGIRVWNVDEKRLESLNISGDPSAIALPAGSTSIENDLICAKGIGLVSQAGKRLREGRQGGRVVAIYPSPRSNVYLVRRNSKYRIETGVTNGRASQINDVPEPRQATFGGDRLSILSMEGTVEVWDTRGSKAMRVLLPFESKIRTAAISPNGEEVWFAFENPANPNERYVHVWDFDTRQSRKTSLLAEGGVIRVIDDERILISTSQSDHIYHADGREIQSYGGDMVQTLVATSGDSIVLGSDGVVRIWKDGAEQVSSSISAGPGRKIQRILSIDGDQLVALMSDGASNPTNTVSAWNMESGAETAANGTCSGAVRTAAAVGGRIAVITTTSGGETLFLGDSSNLIEAKYLQPEMGEVTSVAISPDGLSVAVGMTDGVAMYKTNESGAVVREPITDTTTTDITAIRFSPSGSRVLTGHANGNVAVWFYVFGNPDDGSGLPSDGETQQWGKLVNLRKLHNSPVHTLEFSPSSQSLLTADANGTAVRFAVPADKRP